MLGCIPKSVVVYHTSAYSLQLRETMVEKHLLDLFYRLGRGSTDETRRTLEAIAGQTAGIAIHIDRVTPHLRYEILKWKRRQLIASLKGVDPARVEPPATVRVALLEAFIESKQKLVVHDSEIRESGGESG